MEKLKNQEILDLEAIDIAVEEINKRSPKIGLASFYDSGLFTKAHIDHDIKDVENKRREILEQKVNLSEYQKSRDKIAEFVEVSIPEAIRNLGWLGENVNVIRPSDWDDYFRGIDNVVQMLPDEIIEDENDLKCIGFSIDFTISEKSALDKVFEASLAIARGKVPSMQYFSADIKTKDGDKNIKLRDFKIPRIIMSCPDDVLNKSKNDLLNYEKNPDDENIKEKAKDCVLRYHFIKETLSQLEFFSDLSSKLGNTEAEKVYSESLEIFKELIEEQGIDEKLIKEKTGGVKGLIGAFDLEANNGQWIEILKVMAKNK
jgi:hypothetical protein